MNVRLTIWRKDDNTHSHVMELKEALARGEEASRRSGFQKYVIQSASFTADEALRNGPEA